MVNIMKEMSTKSGIMKSYIKHTNIINITIIYSIVKHITLYGYTIY